MQAAIQSVLDDTTAQKNGPPCLTMAVIGRDGKSLATAASGVKAAGSDEKVRNGMQDPDILKVRQVSADAVFWIASCTKYVTSLAMLSLVEQGKVQLDEDVSRLLPEMKDRPVVDDSGRRASKTAVTLRMLMSHTSGAGYSFFNKHIKAAVDKSGVE
jgi:CubicO group peptidase (beta-lactamase class C family)